MRKCLPGSAAGDLMSEEFSSFVCNRDCCGSVVGSHIACCTSGLGSNITCST